MENLLTSLERHYHGVIILLLLVFAFMVVLTWLIHLFRREKYNPAFPKTQDSNLTFVIVGFFTKIIDDFRNLLALFIVFIFVALIFYGVNSTPDFEQKMKALQVVVASLGGLVGSIIGYYFGESAARKNQTQATTPPPPDHPPPIQPSPPPPGVDINQPDTSTGQKDPDLPSPTLEV